MPRQGYIWDWLNDYHGASLLDLQKEGKNATYVMAISYVIRTLRHL